MTETKINFPAFIIRHIARMTHTVDRKGEGVVHYGMILSHILVSKGISVDGYATTDVVHTQTIGIRSLVHQQLYMWRDVLYSKWEIFELFEDEMNQVWKANGCTAPPPPQGWIPRRLGGIRRGEAGTSEPVEPSVQMPTGEASSSAAPPPQFSSMTNRALMESMYETMRTMQLEHRQERSERLDFQERERHERLQYQERERQERQDFEWRQATFMQSMSDRLGMPETFDFLFGGYHGAASSSQPQCPMDQDPQADEAEE